MKTKNMLLCILIDLLAVAFILGGILYQLHFQERVEPLSAFIIAGLVWLLAGDFWSNVRKAVEQ